MSKEANSNLGMINVPDSVDNAVMNITNDLTQNMGKTLGDIWYLVFGGISHFADKRRMKYAHNLEIFRKELSTSISSIPEENRIDPSIQTTAQALENAKYCLDEKVLRDMFTSLISNSMNSDFSKDVHPSFAEIIKQMSPIDANIIRIFKNSSVNGFAIANYKLNKNGGYQVLLENVFLKYPAASLPECSVSISSLVRLGLLRATYDSHILNENIYIPFSKHLWFKMLQEKFPDQSVTVEKGMVFLTPLGRSFTNVCILD